MKPVRSCRPLLAILVLVLASAFTVAAAHPDVKTPAQVSVHYHNPHKFTESRQSGFGHGFDHGNYLQKLKAFLVHRATPMLDKGQHLSITFTNIDLAGAYEPWHGPEWSNVRFMRDIYPPRFTFTFTLTGANGQVLRQGKRKLIDLAYLYDLPTAAGDTDPLHYDKALLGRWLRRGPAHW